MLSFEPGAINCFRIGGGWDYTNSRIPLCDSKPGDTFKGLQLIAEPPAEEFDQDDIKGFEAVMGDTFARSLLMFKLADAGYDSVDLQDTPGQDSILSIQLWSEETVTSISSHLYHGFISGWDGQKNQQRKKS